ncbi:MAG: glycosyltransferase family 4 protein [Phycisphaerae bacterium]|nr:glycosyltransferase family 4 protein [Phycisphaerae bacterium]
MRILFINRMASMLRGGGETFDVEMARHLQELGCDITFLSGIPLFSGPRVKVTPSNFQFPISSFQIRTPYAGDLRWDKFPGGWRIRQADFALFEWRAFRWAFARKGDFDVVQVCELPRFVAWWRKVATNVPVVMRLTSSIYYDPVRGVEKADAVIASGATLREIRAGTRPDCIDIPNGVDTELFRPHPSSFRQSHGIPDDDLVLLYVARFASVKNHDLLLDAFRLLLRRFARARLVLVGSGSEQARIGAKCRAFGIEERVLFLGETPFEQVPDAYASADIKVIASDYESFSFTALEAMASGLPLVVTDTDWVPKLIGERVPPSPGGFGAASEGRGSRGRVSEAAGGIVVPRRDAEAMAEALERLAGDQALRAKMGQRNREHVVEHYGWESSARKLLDVYARLARESSAKPGD